MYCIICLKNRARNFYCPYCLPKLKKLFKAKQMKVEKETRDVFLSLSVNKQLEVVKLTSKRFGVLLKTRLFEIQDFSIDVMIQEYCKMVSLDHENLDLPKKSNEDRVVYKYGVYESPKEQYK
jgi:hypothetical protein